MEKLLKTNTYWRIRNSFGEEIGANGKPFKYSIRRPGLILVIIETRWPGRRFKYMEHKCLKGMLLHSLENQ